MNTQIAGYLVIYGVFLILLGIAGYMTHPEEAFVSLVSGGGFGALWMLWGILSVKGVRWSGLAALATTALLALACAWQAGQSWLAVAGGQSEKAFGAFLITLVLVLSATMLFFLLKHRKTDGEKAAGGAQ